MKAVGAIARAEMLERLENWGWNPRALTSTVQEEDFVVRNSRWQEIILIDHKARTPANVDSDFVCINLPALERTRTANGVFVTDRFMAASPAWLEANDLLKDRRASYWPKSADYFLVPDTDWPATLETLFGPDGFFWSRR